MMLLPSWETKKSIHEKYKSTCELSGMLSMQVTAFSKIWKMALPFIFIQLPPSDLCSLCQKNTIKVSKMINLEVDIKRERVTEMLKHLKLVEKERSICNESIQLAKQNETSHICQINLDQSIF